YEGALNIYEQAAKQDPKYVVAFIGKGKALFELKNYREALEAYKEVVELDPRNVAICSRMVGIGDIEFKRGDYEGALDAYEQVVKQDHEYAVAFIAKGKTLFELKNYRGALDAYEQAVKQDRKYVGVAYEGMSAVGHALLSLGGHTKEAER